MKPETILKKAIEKAVGNGYEFFEGAIWDDIDWKEMVEGDEDLKARPYFIVIFSHDFAKAFFPKGKMLQINYHPGDLDEPYPIWLPEKEWEITKKEDDRYGEDQVFEEMPSYLYHLSEMVREKDPIKYLEKFL